MSDPCERPECGGEVHTDGWGTPVRCPHGIEPDDFTRKECPHCDEAPPTNRMDKHISTDHADIPPCTATLNNGHGDDLLHCAFRAGHAKGRGEYGEWHVSARREPLGRYVWNDAAEGAVPHEQSLNSGSDEGRPEPPAEDEMRSSLPVTPDPRQPAYDAVYGYIRGLGTYLPPDPVHRNAVIWRAVHAALGATPVGRCVSSHCVEGGHILPVEGEAP